MRNLKEIKLGRCNHLYIHKNNKFKSIGVKIVYKLKFDYKMVSAFNILAKYLGNCNENYPSIESFNKRIDSLYGTSVGIKCDYIGSLFTVSFYINFVNPTYVNDTTLCEDAIELLHDMIYKPLIKNGLFDEEIFNICKENCLIDAKSIDEYNLSSVVNKLKEIISQDKKSPLASNALGNKKVLSKLDNKNALKYYDKLLKAPFDIYVTGKCKFSYIEKIIRKYFTKKNIKNIKYNVFQPIENKQYEPTYIHKKVSQAQVAIAYNVPILFNNPMHYAFRIARFVLSGTLSSKFYKEIRENKGLCYSIGSKYSSYYGTFIITTGVNSDNIKLVVLEIDKQIEQLKNGNISDEEFNDAKEAIINDLLSVNDSLFGVLNMIKTYHNFSYTFSLDEEIKKYNNVTKQDVIKAAKMLTYCTYCALDGE